MNHDPNRNRQHREPEQPRHSQDQPQQSRQQGQHQPHQPPEQPSQQLQGGMNSGPPDQQARPPRGQSQQGPGTQHQHQTGRPAPQQSQQESPARRPQSMQSQPQQQSQSQRQSQPPQQSRPQQSPPPQQATQMHSPPQAMQSQQGPPAQPQQGMQRRQRQIPIQPIGTEEIAETDVVTAGRDDSLSSIVEKMDQEDVGMVVITEDDRPIGLVTDRKIALALRENENVSEMQAADVMTEDPVTVTDEMDVHDVIQTLGDNGIRRVPVVDEEGALRGVVSIDDLVVLLAAEMNQLSEVIESQIERFS